MILLTVILLLSAAGTIGTVNVVRKDGYHRIPTDPSRLPSRG